MKRPICIVCVALMAFSLTACNVSEQIASTTKPEILLEDSSIDSSNERNPLSSEEADMSEENNSEDYLKGLHISYCSDGTSWIKWEDDLENKHYGFMNLDGEIYFELDNKFSDYMVGPIVDGYTYVQSNGNFVLLKTDGTITYQEINAEDDNA